LLQGRGGEGRQRVAPRAFLFDRRDAVRIARRDRRDGALGGGLIAEVELVELLAVEMGEAAGEALAGRRTELAVDGPVFLRLEALDLVLALADDAQRHRLHAAG
jgi:hypothetical protein